MMPKIELIQDDWQRMDSRSNKAHISKHRRQIMTLEAIIMAVKDINVVAVNKRSPGVHDARYDVTALYHAYIRL
jgi:hypothetical protein